MNDLEIQLTEKDKIIQLNKSKLINKNNKIIALKNEIKIINDHILQKDSIISENK